METEFSFQALSPGAETTEALGERLGAALVPGAVIGLVGELGSGKTCLVRGLARGLGVADAIQSPTFTRMRALEGRLALFHFDAWRRGSAELLAECDEFLGGAGVAVIEWADRVAEHLPRPRLELELEHRGENLRGLRGRILPAPSDAGPAARALARALEQALASAASAPGLLRLARS